MVQVFGWSEVQPKLRDYDLIVIGSGLFGLTVAQSVSQLLSKRVLIIERRDHLGGNAFSEIDNESRIEVHKYGPHIFHTSNERVWEYARRFTDFNSYRHHVWSRVADDIYPLPISLATLSKIEGRALDPTQAREWLSSETLKIDSPSNFEEKALASIGTKLYEWFLEGIRLSNGKLTLAKSQLKYSGGFQFDLTSARAISTTSSREFRPTDTPHG